jgi:GMP synthase (glutamine-hydrolysing)
VRKLGVALGLPHDMVYRHPFPGPGLGVRILGEVKKEYADLLREADAIFIDELRKTPFEAPQVPGIDAGKAPINWYEATSQAFVINEVRGINRVVYDISGKPPATIEWE